MEEAGAAGALTLKRGPDGRLHAQLGREEQVVRVPRCFPWSEPGHFIGLRDADDEEFALVTDPAELDGSARAVLEAALAEACFLFDVQPVLELDEEIVLRNWRVLTM